MTESTQLETERLALREPLESDAPQLLEYHLRNAERFDRWEPKRGTDVAQHRQWIEWRQSESAQGRGITFFAFDRATRATLIALASLDAISTEPARTAMLSYSVDGPYEGQGYARETVAATIAYAFGPLDLHHLSATYDPANERSGGLLARMGFVVIARSPVVPGMERLMRAQVLAVLNRPA
ncbi:MAG: GNAT family N-acetyltransferase [Candidatus Eremiobacteraeota bacterium]|nr:GNAT family N-acetyltransferase [Candidatus Eremiobacteraeota bacterium]MBV8369423.1 GNAT family N-acetyltransferase [Candidatus Eremiobacteraeota bacterium]